jgi:hypothetical protein
MTQYLPSTTAGGEEAEEEDAGVAGEVVEVVVVGVVLRW